MKDVQSMPDTRGKYINRVGVKGVKYPIRVFDKKHRFQDTIAMVSMFVSLPENYRGTHMSRFLEVLNEHRERISIKDIKQIVCDLRDKFKAKEAEVEVAFPYFVEKKAPVSSIPSISSYDCKITAYFKEKYDFELSVSVLALSLCPCSKEISEKGAHNQRVKITATVKMNKLVWIEDIGSILEKSASSEIFSLLKREDEKFITEKSYDNPKFVEDIVRDVAIELDNLDGIIAYKVEAESFESIHPHNAYACIVSEQKLIHYQV